MVIMLNVCMLTTSHPPYSPRIFDRESKSLNRNGYSVSIIAPSDRKEKKEVDGINIITVKKPSEKYLHFITMYRIFKAGLKQKCDVYHCHEPGSLLICIILKLIKKNNVIYDAHEHYPSLIAENALFPNYTKKMIEFFLDNIERNLCKSSDKIITVNHTLKTRYDVYKPTTILYNVPPLNIFSPKNTEKSAKTIIYTGNVNKKRGLDFLLHSLHIIKNDHQDVKLLIVGSISDTNEFKTWVESYINDNNLTENFQLTGWVPYEELVEYTQNSTLGVILFQPTYYNNIIGLPNKLFEYMACQIPVVASNLPEIRYVIEDVHCGFLVDPTNSNDIAKAICSIIENPDEAKVMGYNGRKAVEEIYNWENMEKRLLKLYGELT